MHETDRGSPTGGSLFLYLYSQLLAGIFPAIKHHAASGARVHIRPRTRCLHGQEEVAGKRLGWKCKIALPAAFNAMQAAPVPWVAQTSSIRSM